MSRPGAATLTPAARGWRLAVVAVGLVVLGYAQFADTNDLFPFGSLSQYATARDMNGTVRSVFLEAEPAPGDGAARVPAEQRQH